MATVAPTGYAILTFRVRSEDGQYVSECDELGVASCGDSMQDAFDAVRDAVEVYLETLDGEGERNRVLSERGVTIVAGEPRAQPTEVQIRAHPNEFVSPQVVRLPSAAA